MPLEFAHTCAAEGVMTGVAGAALIGTLTLLLAEQPAPFDAVSISVTLPEAPAEYVID